MSLITRCPACETLFKVVPDQLRISEGWVRCGQCDEVFDASVHLVKDAPQPIALPAVEPEPTPAPLTEMTQDDMSAATSQFTDLDLDFSAMEVESSKTPKLVLDFGEASAASDADDAVTDSPAPAVEPLDAERQKSEVTVEADSETGNIASDASNSSSADVSFLRAQSAPSVWRRPLIRAAMSALALGLLLTLAGQFVVHERNRLAAHEPRLTPWLLAFCAPLGCSLAPVQRIESVVIESSSFAKVRDETYRLSYTLRNSANIPLATPAVELTLTDALDQPVMRRVVLPAELDALPVTLEPGLAMPVTVTFFVKTDATSLRMAGYRLLAFYP